MNEVTETGMVKKSAVQQWLKHFFFSLVLVTMFTAGTANAFFGINWNSFGWQPPSPVYAVATGQYHTLGLRQNGTVSAWGSNTYGQSSVPAGLSGVIAISAGLYHSVALKSDGTVVVWGNNSYGQLNVPVGLTGVKAIAAGHTHTVALKYDGTVAAWGNNASGQSTIPGNVTGITSVAAGAGHTVALRSSDGAVFIIGTSAPAPPPAFTGGTVAVPSLNSLVN
ncbi:MAG: RCC1 domain-containing protein [Desulfuromonadaceae bacterium]